MEESLDQTKGMHGSMNSRIESHVANLQKQIQGVFKKKNTKDSMKGLVELEALRGLKTVLGLMRWSYGIIFVQVFITKF